MPLFASNLKIILNFGNRSLPKIRGPFALQCVTFFMNYDGWAMKIYDYANVWGDVTQIIRIIDF